MSRKVTKKKAISMALAAALTLSSITVPAFAAASDINGHWAEKTITAWQEKGLISGYEDGSFKPDRQVTRAEFVVIMNNALGLTKEGEVSFSDVKAENWFYKAVSIAVEAGYVSGYEDGTFKPNATITRAEAAVMIAQAKGLKADESGADKFSDEVPAWAKGYVGAVVNAGYMSGYPDGTFGATKSITRAEAVSSLDRVIGGTSDIITDKDLVVDKADQVVDGETVEGNLIIAESVGNGDATIKNTVIEGDLIIKGGGSNTVVLENVNVEGKTVIAKDGVRVQLRGETKLPKVNVEEVSKIVGESFEGEVGTITITEALGTSESVVISVPAEKIVIQARASVKVNAEVATVEIAEEAEGAQLNVSDEGKVETVVADAKVAISGQGKIETLEVNADGVTITSGVKVESTEVADGVKEPVRGSTSSGGGNTQQRPNKDEDNNGGGENQDNTAASIELDKTAITLKKGNEHTFTATVKNASNEIIKKDVTWTATLKDGTTTLPAGVTFADGKITVTSELKDACTVTVTAKADKVTETATVKIENETATVDSVKVTPAKATVIKGKTETFTAELLDATGNTVTNTGTIEFGLDSSYSGGKSSITEAGVLTVGADETETTLTVKATYTSSDSSVTKYGTATVTVKDTPVVTSIEVKAAGDATTVEQGATLQFTAKVKDQDNEGMPDEKVTWSVTGGSTGTSIDASTGLLKVAAGETAEKELKVVATSTTATDVKSAEYTVTVKAPKKEISTVTIAGLVAPATGNAAQTLEELKGQNSSLNGFSITGLTFYETAVSSPVSGNFEAKKTYKADIVLTATAGTHKFVDTLATTGFTVTGFSTVTAALSGTDNDTLTLTVTFDATVEEISTVKITGLVAPELGETPVATVSTDTTGVANGSSVAVTWTDADSTFAAEKSYSAKIELTADTNYKFANSFSDTNITLESLSAGTKSVQVTEKGAKLTITVSFDKVKTPTAVAAGTLAGTTTGFTATTGDTVTITLTNGKFASDLFSSGNDASAWISNLSTVLGSGATVTGARTSDTVVTLTFAGTPTETTGTELTISIPTGAVKGYTTAITPTGTVTPEITA